MMAHRLNLACFVNKVFFSPMNSTAFELPYCLWLPSHCNGRVEHCRNNRDHMACKSLNIFHLTPYRQVYWSFSWALSFFGFVLSFLSSCSPCSPWQLNWLWNIVLTTFCWIVAGQTSPLAPQTPRSNGLLSVPTRMYCRFLIHSASKTKLIILCSKSCYSHFLANVTTIHLFSYVSNWELCWRFPTSYPLSLQHAASHLRPDFPPCIYCLSPKCPHLFLDELICLHMVFFYSIPSSH